MHIIIHIGHNQLAIIFSIIPKRTSYTCLVKQVKVCFVGCFYKWRINILHRYYGIFEKDTITKSSVTWI